MKFLRRAIVALGAAFLVSTALKVKGKGGVPPQQGGWREVTPQR